MAGWKYHVNINQYISPSNYLQDMVLSIRDELVFSLPNIWLNTNSEMYDDVYADIISRLSDFETISEENEINIGKADEILSDIYNWANKVRIWCGV